MVVALGLACAVVYGLGDFFGGLASRRHTGVSVLLYSYPVGAVLMFALLPLFPGELSGRVVGFGIAGGVAGMAGLTIMYSLFTLAPMNVISPITAVLAAIVPVVVGVGLGERPSMLAWLGIVLALAAVVLVSYTTDEHPHGKVAARLIALACLSGLGFGLYFVFLARAGHDAGLLPLVVSRVTSAVLILPLAARFRGFVRIRGRYLVLTLAAGLCDAGANFFFLLASHHGLLSVASVLAALYPAATVLLAVTLLREHLSAVQRVGLVLATGAIVLVTL